MSQLPGQGEMIAVNITEKEAYEIIKDYQQFVSVAAINGEKSVVIAGFKEQIEIISSELEKRDLMVKPLTVSHAFHSPQLVPMLKEFRDVATKVNFGKPEIQFISNLYGRTLQDGEMNGEYWSRHTREAVRFNEGIKELLTEGFTHFIE